MRRTVLALLATLPIAVAVRAEPDPKRVLREAFERVVRERVAEVEGVLGVTIRDLVTGESLSLHGDMVFTQASAIKLPVLVELYRQAEEGAYSLDDEVTLEASAIVGGSGVLRQLTPGRVRMPLRDVATLMVTVSDNTATNLIIDRVGMENVNATMERLGLASTRIARKMMDATAWREDRENLSTPDEQARLLELLHRGEILDEESRQEIWRILSIPKPGQIRELLPDGTEVAHKTGTLSGVVVDVGIVYLPDRPFIVSAMGNWLVSSEEAEGAIAEIALLAYRYFDRLAHSNAYGHRK